MPIYHIDFSDKIALSCDVPFCFGDFVGYRIISDETFTNKATKKVVRKGDKGGYVSSKEILLSDSKDTSWVFPNAIVVGKSSVRKDSAIVNSKVYSSNVSRYSVVSGSKIFQCGVDNSKIENVNGSVVESIISNSFCAATKEKTLEISRLNIAFSTVIASQADFSIEGNYLDPNFINFKNSKIAFKESGTYRFCASYTDAFLEYRTDFDIMSLLASKYRYCHYYKTRDNYRIAFCGDAANRDFTIDVTNENISENAICVFPGKKSMLSSLFLKETEKICKNFFQAIGEVSPEPISKEKTSVLIAAEFFFLLFVVMESEFQTESVFKKILINLKDKTFKENGVFFVSKNFLHNFFNDSSIEEKILCSETCCLVEEAFPF